MTSVHSHILNHKLTGGHFIGLGVANCGAFPTYTEPTSSSTGFLNSAGSVFNFSSSANALTAIAAAFSGSKLTLSAGVLLQDMGDRVVFSAAGQTIAIFGKVRQLATAAYEGNETPYYICMWAADPAAIASGGYETLVGVARL
jgi:hypothetical protein